MPRPLVVFDTETATTRGAPHLLEIGAVRIEDGDITGHFEALVRPEVRIDEFAFHVHGIDDEMVRDARPAKEVIAAFLAFAGDDWLVAHNAPFDAGVLAFEAARYGLTLPSSPLIDTLKLSRRYLPEASDHKLDTLTAHLDIEVEVHHRALADAVSCSRVLEACIERMTADDAACSGEALFFELLARGSSRLTLASAAPQTPRIPTRLRGLAHACRDRSAVTLLYGEDGAPARLPVAPRLLFKLGARDYLEAECVRSGTLKTYRLDRVQRLVD
ncbi:MAG: 3'-5' exoribonuclease [Planctomycetes bacterium]|nr:3'-5' exoribonuclease [Planctomycetota bacterium]